MARALPRETARFAAAAPAARIVFLALVALSVLAGIAGGLMRFGVMLPSTAGAAWLGRAAIGHAALMTGGFLGTVIGLERAVAVKHPAAFIAPLASGLSGLCLVLGQNLHAGVLAVVAAVAFTLVNLVVVRRQWASHTLLLLAAAAAWLIGNVLFALGRDGHAILPWWFAFLVMTIAAERLEMTRLMRRRPAAPVMLVAVLCTMVLGAAISSVSIAWGGALYGLSMLLLSLWLVTFDIARRTVFAHGLSRYMAICLLAGYFWLAIAGVAWAGTALGLPLRDVALHALALGFIFSMIMGHGPVILPAIARVKLQFGLVFYVPLAALHLSLAFRLGVGFFEPQLRGAGAIFNGLSIALFAATMAGAVVGWRVREQGARAGET